MPLDLSKVEARSGSQRRLTTNRDAVLPTSRDTSAPALEVNARMSSARRSDAGAQELMRIFGGMDNAAGSFADYANTKFSADEARNAQQGVRDQALGTVDPELEQKSAAYRKSVSTGNGVKGVYDMFGGLNEHLETALNDPEHPADLETVHKIITQHYHDFAIVDGKVRDFGSPEANMAVGQLLQENELRLVEQSRAKIKAHVETQSVENASANTQSSLDDGSFTFENSFSQIAPGVDPKVAKGAIIDSVHDWALSKLETEPDKALAAIDSLLTSKRADGSPSLNADERDKLRVQRITMSDDVDRAKKKLVAANQDAAHEKLLSRLANVPGAGAPPSLKEIRGMVADGTLDPKVGYQMVHMIETDMKQDAREAARDAREAARDARDRITPSEASIIDGVFSGKLSLGQGNAMAMNAAASGALGTGPDRYRRLANIRKNLTAASGMVEAQKRGIIDYVDGWEVEATAAAKAQIKDLGQRMQATREIKDAAKAMKAGAVVKANNPSGDGIGEAMSLGRAHAVALHRKYGIQ